MRRRRLGLAEAISLPHMHASTGPVGLRSLELHHLSNRQAHVATMRSKPSLAGTRREKASHGGTVSVTWEYKVKALLRRVPPDLTHCPTYLTIHCSEQSWQLQRHMHTIPRGVAVPQRHTRG